MGQFLKCPEFVPVTGGFGHVANEYSIGLLADQTLLKGGPHLGSRRCASGTRKHPSLSLSRRLPAPLSSPTPPARTKAGTGYQQHAAVLPTHTVEYKPFFKSQLASLN